MEVEFTRSGTPAPHARLDRRATRVQRSLQAPMTAYDRGADQLRRTFLAPKPAMPRDHVQGLYFFLGLLLAFFLLVPFLGARV